MKDISISFRNLQNVDLLSSEKENGLWIIKYSQSHLDWQFSKNFFKDQISNSESLFLLKRGKRDVQVGALSFEL